MSPELGQPERVRCPACFGWHYRGEAHTCVGALTESDRSASLSVDFDSILHQVWLCERDWRFDDRIRLQHDPGDEAGG